MSPFKPQAITTQPLSGWILFMQLDIQYGYLVSTFHDILKKRFPNRYGKLLSKSGPYKDFRLFLLYGTAIALFRGKKMKTSQEEVWK